MRASMAEFSKRAGRMVAQYQLREGSGQKVSSLSDYTCQLTLKTLTWLSFSIFFLDERPMPFPGP